MPDSGGDMIARQHLFEHIDQFCPGRSQRDAHLFGRVYHARPEVPTKIKNIDLTFVSSRE